MILVVVLATAAAAVIERIVFVGAWHEPGALTSGFYYGDAETFVRYARALARGEVFDNGIPFHPAGWPWVLSLAAGATPEALKVMTACLGGLTVGLAALLAWCLAGRGAMLAAALLGTFNFGHLVMSGGPNSEPLFGLIVVVVQLLMVRWVGAADAAASDAQGPRWGWAAAAGLAAGAAALVRAEFLLGAVLVAAIGWRLRGRPAWREGAVCAAACLVAITPVTVSNWRHLSAFNDAHREGFPGPLPRLAPVTSYGAFNFAMANHERADGGPNRDHPRLDACDDEAGALLDQGQLELACPATYDLYVHGYSIGASWLLAHPADALSLWWSKAARTSGFLAEGYLLDDVGAGTDGVRRRVDAFDPSGLGLLPIHVLMSVAGAWLLRRRPRALGVLAVTVGTLAASTLLFYGYVRLGLAYLPTFWVLQGTALAWIAERVIPPALKRRAPAWVLAGILVLLAVEGARMRASRTLILDGPRFEDGTLIQDEDLNVQSKQLD